MPRIFDNIELYLSPALEETLKVADRSDFCVGYFNLRGWRQIDAHIEKWQGGDASCCRLLVGMHKSPGEELREAMRIGHADDGIDNQKASKLKRELAEEFRNQLMVGFQTNADEEGLRR